jgi:DNA-binding MarR family transcriptional regulator
MYIRCKGSCTVTDIANHLGITLSAVTSLVDKLCILGLVIRIRSEMDRRVVFMKLTEEGVRVLEEVDEKRNEIFEKAFSNLSIEEINNFFSVIDKVTENILNSKVEKPNKLYNMGD